MPVQFRRSSKTPAETYFATREALSKQDATDRTLDEDSRKKATTRNLGKFVAKNPRASQDDVTRKLGESGYSGPETVESYEKGSKSRAEIEKEKRAGKQKLSEIGAANEGRKTAAQIAAESREKAAKTGADSRTAAARLNSSSRIEAAKITGGSREKVAETGAGAKVKSSELAAKAKTEAAKIASDARQKAADIVKAAQVEAARIRGEAAREVAKTGAGARVESSNIAAGASRDVANTNAGARVRTANISADASRDVANTNAFTRKSIADDRLRLDTYDRAFEMAMKTGTVDGANQLLAQSGYPGIDKGSLPKLLSIAQEIKDFKWNDQQTTAYALTILQGGNRAEAVAAAQAVPVGDPELVRDTDNNVFSVQGNQANPVMVPGANQGEVGGGQYPDTQLKSFTAGAARTNRPNTVKQVLTAADGSAQAVMTDGTVRNLGVNVMTAAKFNPAQAATTLAKSIYEADSGDMTMEDAAVQAIAIVKSIQDRMGPGGGTAAPAPAPAPAAAAEDPDKPGWAQRAWQAIFGGGQAKTPAPAETAAAPPAAAPAAPQNVPTRPRNLPRGSQYSPSRRQWRSPDGTIYDESGTQLPL